MIDMPKSADFDKGTHEAGKTATHEDFYLLDTTLHTRGSVYKFIRPDEATGDRAT